MKIQKILAAAAALVSTLIVTSCADDIVYGDDANNAYAQAFALKYGLIDPNHTWNQAKRSQVTIRLDQPADTITVYGVSDGGLHPVAKCVGAKSTVTLPFDVPYNVYDIVVKVGHRYYTTEIGGTVDVAARSRGLEGTPDAHGCISNGKLKAWPVTDPAEYLYFQANELLPIVADGSSWEFTKNGVTYSSAEYGHSLVPEETENRGTSVGDDDVVEDFKFISDGNPIVIYPMYWNTNQRHRLGAYYMDGETMVKLPLYLDKSYGGDCMLQKGESSMTVMYAPGNNEGYRYILNNDWNNPLDNDDAYAWLRTLLNTLYANKDSYTDLDGSSHSAAALSAAKSTIESNLRCTLNTATSYVTLYANSVEIGIFTAAGSYFYKGLANSGENKAFNPNSATPMASKGFYLQVEEGTEYGFYLELDVAHTANIYTGYSSAIRTSAPYNESEVTVYSQKVRNANGSSYAATYYNPVSERMYFSFDDYYSNYDVTIDLNDLIFTVGGLSKQHVISDDIPDTWTSEEGSPYTWLVAAEDLGAIGDFDFNDVIVGISALPTTYIDEGGVNRQVVTKVEFTALAAGGILPIYLHFDYQCEGGDHVAETLYNGITGETYHSSISDGLLFPDGKSASQAEFHKWFGSGNASVTTMINTGRSAKMAGMTSTIYVNEEYAMENYGKVQNGNIDGFYITVGSPEKGEGTTLTPPGPGEAPQMFLITDQGPDELGGNGWWWPAETNDITRAYPVFSDWITGGAAYNNWHTRNNFNRSLLHQR